MTQSEPKTGKTTDTRDEQQTSREMDPRAELGLKSPAKDAAAPNERTKRQDAEGQKATQFDGNPNPKGAASSPLGPKDDTPWILQKKSGDKQ